MLCRRSRGFGFIEYRDPRDADDAMYRMDGSNIGGRDITVRHFCKHRLQVVCTILPGFVTSSAQNGCFNVLCQKPAGLFRHVAGWIACMLLQVVQSKEARKTPREMIYRDGKPCYAVALLTKRVLGRMLMSFHTSVSQQHQGGFHQWESNVHLDRKDRLV